MDRKLFYPNDRVLFVGEGNLSFALSFVNQPVGVAHVTATCFESPFMSERTKDNAEALNKSGVPLYFNIDATQLSSYPQLLEKRFSCIIFNFPHIGGKMKISKNRQLLKEFFASAASLLSSVTKGAIRRIIVSLCKGQGGTPADGDFLRAWGDSWQVSEMAAMSGLVLTQAEPFQRDLCPEYSSVGYRGRDNWFHTENALVYVFQPCHPLLVHPRISDSDHLVSVETIKGTLKCDRIFMEFAGFAETKQDYFVQYIHEKSSLHSLAKLVHKNLEFMLGELSFVAGNELPLHYNLSASNVPCEVHNTLSWLRSDLGSLLSSPEDAIFAFGPVFQNLGGDFNSPPCLFQAYIKYHDYDRLISVLPDILAKLFTDKKPELKVALDPQSNWKLMYECAVVAKSKTKNSVIVDIGVLASKIFNASNFRDVIEFHCCDSKCPRSLYPQTHTLDICFIEDENFSEDLFFTVLWRSIGRWLIEVKLLNRYVPEGEEWTSRCYRFWYRSSREALSRTAAITLHEKILPNVLISSGVAVRVL